MQMKRDENILKCKKQKNERGAIVVEATIALTAFIFAIYTILSIVNICYIQAKISIALDAAAEDLSQYSYLYYRFGIDNLQSELHEGTDESRDMVSDTISGIGLLMDNMDDIEGSVNTGDMTVDFDNLSTALNDTGQTFGKLSDNVNQYADALAEDPKGFIMGMGRLVADELSGQANSLLGQAMGKAFMKRNLKSFAADDADTFLKHYHVKDGLAGLDFSGTQLMTYGVSNNIQLVCTYEVEVVKLLNFDYSVKFRQCAKTSAWGNGVSKITPEISTTSKQTFTIWDMSDAAKRGKLIVSYEKDNFTYIDSGNGYDAYNNTNGANEFVSIISKDTHAKTYSTSGGIASELNKTAADMYRHIEGMGEEVNLHLHSGAETTVKSNPDTRTYKIILVVPDDSDMGIVNQAVADFLADQESMEHYNISVDVKKGYGSPAPKESQSVQTNENEE